jgi:exoribonuclease R
VSLRQLRRLRYRSVDGAELRAGFDAIRRELDVPADFPDDVRAEAEQVLQPDRARVDRIDIPFLTIDPVGSMDLDQALYIERRGSGYRVHYAIADVAAFVRPNGKLDAECHRRVMTLYFPDGRTPLHPPVLSENAASLLPGRIRPAALWTIDLDSSGQPERVEVHRALIRSGQRFDYAGVQAALDSSTSAEEPLVLLREVGRLRQEKERERGGVDLPIPEQEVVEQNGSFGLAFRSELPVEGWNAQISLLSGMAAAEIMLRGRIGLLRTLPQAPAREIERLRRVAHGLGIDWPDGVGYGEVVRTLDPGRPVHAAMLEEFTSLLRGAGYTCFDGTVPDHSTHAALAAPYAHVTAPLRRLADRYATEVCLALVAGAAVPDWVRAALPRLPEEMSGGSRRAATVERASLDLVEAYLLRDRVGEVFDAVVIDADADDGVVQVRTPAVRARCDGVGLPLGTRVRVRLVQAEPAVRAVRFAVL